MVEKLIRGLHSFQTGVFSSYQDLFTHLVQNGQSPKALFITCSDSRIVTSLITQSSPGDLFILRNAGNIVPRYDENTLGGEAATIEFAVAELGVQDIVVCGHTCCGYVQAFVSKRDLSQRPAIKNWLTHIQPVCGILEKNYGHVHGGDLVDVAVQENVLVQLENLRTHPSVANALAAGKVTLHGWVYDLPTGGIRTYQVDKEQFEPLVLETECDLHDDAS